MCPKIRCNRKCEKFCNFFLQTKLDPSHRARAAYGYPTKPPFRQSPSSTWHTPFFPSKNRGGRDPPRQRPPDLATHPRLTTGPPTAPWKIRKGLGASLRQAFADSQNRSLFFRVLHPPRLLYAVIEGR